jgi:hypothetical protein
MHQQQLDSHQHPHTEVKSRSDRRCSPVRVVRRLLNTKLSILPNLSSTVPVQVTSVRFAEK